MTAKEFIVLLTEDDIALLDETGNFFIGFEVEREQEQGRGGGFRPKRPISYGYEVFEEDESVLMLLGVM